MATLEKYLTKLKTFKTEMALAAIESPSEITERNYAYATGFNAGLRQAEKLLDEVLKAEAGEK